MVLPVYSNDKLSENEKSKMCLLGNWHTEDYDRENLNFSVFSAGVRSKNSNIQNYHKVFILRYVEIAKKMLTSINSFLIQ